jgi:hypothetical protein
MSESLSKGRSIVLTAFLVVAVLLLALLGAALFAG